MINEKTKPVHHNIQEDKRTDTVVYDTHKI